MERSTGEITTAYTDPNAVSSVQTLALNDFATGDTFTLTFGGQTTSSIAWNATTATLSADIQTKFRALSTVGTANASVVSTNYVSHAITFTGTMAGQAQGAITVTGATGFTPSAVVQTTEGQMCKTTTVGLGSRFGQVMRVRAGLFENASTNDITITDAAGRTVWDVNDIDTNVSGVLYDQFIGYDGIDNLGDAVANLSAGVFESPLTVKVWTAAAATGKVALYVKGGRAGTAPRFRERSTGTITCTAGGAATGYISLGNPFGIIRRLRFYGFDTSTDVVITDALAKTIFTDTAINMSAAAYDYAVSADGIDQSGNANSAAALPILAKSPLTVTIANGGTSTTGSIKAYVEM